MTISAAESFNQALELFSSLFQDISPTDLPAGLSPDNNDVSYLPGGVFTRPATQKSFVNPPESGDLVSLTEFAMPSGNFLTMFMYSSGNLWQQDNVSDVITLVGAASPGSQFRSVTAFDKQWFAFYNQALSDAFTESPFSGADVPKYYDGKNVWRVTQDAPAINPIYTNVATAPIAIVQSAPAGTLSISAAVSSGAQTQSVTYPGRYGPPYTESGPTYYPPVTVKQTVYTTITYTTTAAVPGTWINTLVTVTGLTGTNSSLVNVSGIVVSVGTNQFTISHGTGTTLVNLSGEHGTTTLSGNFFIRSGNNVTAYTGAVVPTQFQPGFYAQIINTNGTQIDGPSWTIASIARDSTGLVTVEISTQLTNLPSGASLYINASDTTDFPAGFQTVFQVLGVSGGNTVFTISDPTWGNGAVVTSSGGSVFQQWSGVFEILTTGVDGNGNNFFTYFQLGPDTNLSNDSTGTPQAQISAQIAPGPRNAVIMFKSVNGAITAPSVPVQLSVNGGTSLLSAQQLPIGPPGTAQRILAFTAAYGASYFYITPSFVPSAAGLSPVLSLGTIINDNTTFNVTLDFSDATLLAGTEIDIQGNDLFNQIVLAPCLGCIEYEGRMSWWGEINNVKNLLNCGFDGGYVPLSGTVNTLDNIVTLVSGDEWTNFNGIEPTPGQTIYINGLPYIIQLVNSGTSLNTVSSIPTQTSVPYYLLSPNGLPVPAWTCSDGVALTLQVDQSLGFAAQMISSSGVEVTMDQPCYHDFYGAPIIEPNTPYIFRCLASMLGPAGEGQLSASIWSRATGFLIGCFINTLPPLQGWVTGSIPALATIPADAFIRIGFESGAGGSTPNTLTIDEVEFIDASQPVLFQQMRVSYFDNPFGYDDETGLLGIDGSAKITAAFKQRSYLYALTDGPLYQTQNNGQTEPNDWSFTAFADECDCYGPNAVATTEDIAWWAGELGFRIFSGDKPKKLSQEIQPTWESINDSIPTSVWVTNDPDERLVYIGVPTGTATKPSVVLPMSYRSVDAAYNVPDPLHTSYSGKMIATDLCRKWTIWNLPMQCGAILTRPGLQKQMFFGGPFENTEPGPQITTTTEGIATGFSFVTVASTAGLTPFQSIVVGTGASAETVIVLSVIAGAFEAFFAGTHAPNVPVFSVARPFFVGNLYSLNPLKYTDDDFGQIFSYYTTYFFFNHDTESQAPGLGLHQKIYAYLTAYITGVGQIQPTALINNLNNPWTTTETVWDDENQIWAESGSAANPIPAYPLTLGDLKNDLEWGLNINSGARMAIKWAAIPLNLPGETDAAFNITHVVLSAHQNIIPVRGAL